MRIAVLGTGDVGRALAGRLGGLGHDVDDRNAGPGGDRAPGRPRGLVGAAPRGAHRDVRQAADGADVVVNAAGGDVCLDVLSGVEAHLDGVVLLDVSNPLDKHSGFPPTLFVANDDSLAERIQARFPAARVVKSLNTMNNRVMVEPARLGESTTVFVSGDDAEAKSVVSDLLRQMGHDDVFDLGDLSTLTRRRDVRRSLLVAHGRGAWAAPTSASASSAVVNNR